MITLRQFCLACCVLLLAGGPALGSGFGVFTQGASGLGQANAVVAHPTGPSSLYFNPALLNDVPGRQLEVGTTGIHADREIKLDSGGTVSGDSSWDFPSTFYYTHQLSSNLTAGLGVFFPFGLTTEWPEDYEGKYLGTSGEVFTANINPAVSLRVNDRLSLAMGLNLLYLDATLQKKINQTGVYILTDLILSNGQGGALPPLAGPLDDIGQKFEGDGWGVGYNLGALYKVTGRVSIGATYRSHIDVDVDGTASFSNVHPLFAGEFTHTGGSTDIRLPQQATAGVAVRVTDRLLVEAGVRWEDWDSTEQLRVDLNRTVFGRSADVIPRDWASTWSYNLGGQYRLNQTLALNAGYLYGRNPVPDATFEPIIPDSDAHLFTLGAELTFGAWTVAGAFGYEHHEDRRKSNDLGDPLGSQLAGTPVGTANGSYQSDLYLLALSVGYRF